MLKICHFTSPALGEKPAERDNRGKHYVVCMLCNRFNRRKDIINISPRTIRHLTDSQEHLLCMLTALCTCAVAVPLLQPEKSSQEWRFTAKDETKEEKDELM